MVNRRQKPERILAPAEYKLPDEFHLEIGRISVSWAYFENGVRRVIWRLLGVDERMGRVAVRDPRIDDRLEMIADLAFLKQIKIDEKRLQLLKTRANEVLSNRDLLAHGVWVPHQGKWFVQKVSGSYPSEHRKRRIAPEGMIVDIEGLQTVSNAVEILIEMIKEIGDEIVAQLPQSPEKRPE
jgi:hypothetical protein